MQRSGMLSLMDGQAHDQWYRSLESKDLPTVSEESIYSTFEQLSRDKGEVLKGGSSICSKRYPGIIKPTVRVVLARK